MADKKPTDKSREPDARKRVENHGAKAGGDGIVDASKLTPEEQMALYEKDLKENDWGHQPC